jgi:hypothetical protein
MMLATFSVPLGVFDDDTRAGADAGALADLLELIRNSGTGPDEMRSRKSLSTQGKQMISELVKDMIRLEEQRAA